MYTLGTSQLRWIASQQSTDIQATLSDKLVAYVGTAQERTATGADQIAMGAQVAFFQINNPASVTLYTCQITNGLWSWVLAGDIPGPENMLQQLQMASGWTNYIFAIQRGDTASFKNALASDGVMFWDHQQEALWIFDSRRGKWRSVLHGYEPGVVMQPGMMIGWSNSIAVPAGFLRCKGEAVNIADYPQLYAVIGNTFGTAPSGQFRLPTRDDFIINVAQKTPND